MSQIKNGRLDQYGAEPFRQQQFGPAVVEGVNNISTSTFAALQTRAIEMSLTTTIERCS